MGLQKDHPKGNESKSKPLRHRTLYIASGDVVLRVESKGEVYLFRVHRATLSHHSVIFATIFKGRSEVSSARTYDGAPVVSLQNEPTDVTAFLEVVYGHDHIHMKRYDPDAALFALKALKLIDMYECVGLRDRIVRHIEADWPKSALEWVALHRVKQAYADVSRFHGEYEPVENKFPEPASAIRLAWDCGIPSILPAAYLALVNVSTAQDWDTVRDGDELLPFDVKSARWNLLDSEDIRRLRRGKIHFWHQRGELLDVIFDVPPSGCMGPSLDCQAELKYRRNEVTEDENDEGALMPFPTDNLGIAWRLGLNAKKAATSAEHRVGIDPLVLLQDISDAVPDYGLCERCSDCVCQNVAREMQRCWADLSAIFSLPKASTDTA